MSRHALTEDYNNVLVVSDTHVGNVNAICSPYSFHKIHDRKKRNFVKKIYEAWKYCLSRVSRQPVDLLIINGDVIDGDNKKDLGSEVWTTKMLEQVDDAVDLFKEIKFANVIVTTGSGYHVKRNADHFEDVVAERLARYETDGELGEYLRRDILPKYHTKVEGRSIHEEKAYRYTDYKWKFAAFNEVFSVTHHVPHSRVEFYRSTPIAREMVTTELDSGKYAPSERPTILLRSHTHWYTLLDFSSSTGIITPAFKFADEYLNRGGIGGTLPTVGMEEIKIWENKPTDFIKILAKGPMYPKEPLKDATPFFRKLKEKRNTAN